MGFLKHRSKSAPEPIAPNRLDSWKDIAAYLNRAERTVQRWEAEEGLPVRRLLHEKQGSVYAFKDELDEWWESLQPRLEEEKNGPPAVVLPVENPPGNAAAAWPVASTGGRTEAVSRASARPSWLPWVLAAVSGLAAVMLVLLWPWEGTSDFPSARFALEAPPGYRFLSPMAATAISPDGRYLVFSATPDGTAERAQIYLRRLDSLSIRPLPGTEGGAGNLFWSPDSNAVAFFTPSKLKRVDIAGGEPQELCDHAGFPFVSGAWSDDGIILFGSDGRLFQVPESGGISQELTVGDLPIHGRLYNPQFLPDGRHFLYVIRTPDPNTRGIYAGSLDDPGEQVRIVSSLRKAYYVPPRGGQGGYLLWVRGQSLLAQRFDAGRMRLEGEAVTVVEEVDVAGPNAAFWASDTGLLVYRSGRFFDTRPRSLTWFDRQGNVIGTAGDPHAYGALNLSPDGSRVAVFRGREDNLDEVVRDQGQDLWIIHFARPGQDTRLTTGPANESFPVWSPDSREIIFASNRDQLYFHLYRKFAGSLGEGEPLLTTDEFKTPMDWSSDEQFLLYLVNTEETEFDLWVRPLEGDQEPEPYLVTEFDEGNAQFSPDGKWVAYTSDRTGESKVYVSPFPRPDSPDEYLKMIPISIGGGRQPRWRQDSEEMYYLSPDDTLMAVAVTTDPSFEAGIPSPLFNTTFAFDSAYECWLWDVTPDGERFLVNRPPAETREVPPLTVVTNWQAELPE